MSGEEYLEVKFRLHDGTDIGPRRYLSATTVATLKESILAQWPKGLKEKYDKAMRRNDVKAIVVTGNGSIFSGGFDINVLQEVQQTGNLSHLGRVSVDLMINTIEEAKKPSVAAIQGLALGGGLELAMSCHARISTPKAQLGFPELQFGIIPGFGDHWTIIAPSVHVIVVSMNGFFCFLASIMTIWGGLLYREGYMDFVTEFQNCMFENTYLLKATEENKVKVFGKDFMGWANPQTIDDSVWEDAEESLGLEDEDRDLNEEIEEATNGGIQSLAMGALGHSFLVGETGIEAAKNLHHGIHGKGMSVKFR